ncbi:MAG: DUF6687 family protein [Pseudonocardiaceae bacterium]
MASNPLRYDPYEASVGVPNVVVDGSPNASTVLTLSHWPQLPAPDGLADDLSAQMAFRYLDSGATLHGNAEVVTNNHFDQDGLISVYALSRPDAALARRALLEDVAAAGDFGTYRDRRAARLSMVIAAFSDPERSPLAPLPDDHGGAATALLYTELLGRLPELLDKLDTYRNLWQDEDRQLTSSEHILATGAAVIDEHGEVDLAVVTIDETVGALSGHRFTGGVRFDGIHPMALHNATDRFAVLVIRGRSYQFTYRYETWVQYRSRRPRPRVDLTALAGQLTERETDGVTWGADPASSLTPRLSPIGNNRESSIPAAEVVSRVVGHLTMAAPAWDPYP